MKNIAGIFYNRLEASKAVGDLIHRGFTPRDVSMMMSEETRKQHFHDEGPSKGEQAAKGGVAGAAVGGTLGAILAGLTAIGSLTIPGVGLLAAGPIVAALSGAGLGAAVGGLSGALISAGFTDRDARHYEDLIRKGAIVLIVRTDNEDEILAANEILRLHEAETETV
jgi:hypothetical protein